MSQQQQQEERRDLKWRDTNEEISGQQLLYITIAS